MQRRLLVLVALAVVVVVVLLHVLRAGEPLGVDQGLFACFARWVPHGALPYRDLFDSKPPLFLYAWSLSALVPGDVALAMWRLETLWLLGSLAVMFVVVRRIAGDAAGVAAAVLLLVGLWSPAWGGPWSRAQAEELAVLPMLLAAHVALGRPGAPPSARRMILLGALTGIVGLFKIPTMAIAAAWPMLWIEHGRRASVRAALWALLGLAIPWAAAAAWFAAHGAFGDFIDGVFVYHRYNAQFIAPPWLPTIGTFLGTLVTSLPLLLVLAAAGLVTMQRRERRFAGVWIGATAVAVVLQRQLAEYHYLLVVPGLAIAGGCGVAGLARAIGGTGRRRAIGAAVAAVAAVLAIREVVVWSGGYAADLAYVRGKLARPAYLGRFERGAISPAVEERLAGWVSDHVPEGEHILIWGLAPAVYALADRAPATRYPFHKILMTEAPLSRMIPGFEDRRAELLARVDADRPAVIIIERNDRNGFEPETSLESLMHWQAFAALVKERYAWETEIGRFIVFRRKS